MVDAAAGPPPPPPAAPIYAHRLHYGWQQLEADRSGTNVGSPSLPLPKVDRTLRLQPGRHYAEVPVDSAACPAKRERFKASSSIYKTVDYNTLTKNGCLKLTEMEVFFLSTWITRATVGDWLLVYLGIGNGERFRYLRDEFFPNLSVIAFDPVDPFYTGERDDVIKRANEMSNDGTNFTFNVRCFDPEQDTPEIELARAGKKLLLISDIRGMALLEDNWSLDKASDQDLQWRAIKSLKPVSSVVKFVVPTPAQYYDYAPGVLLKQVFNYVGSLELRLVVSGVPERSTRYNSWEIYERMAIHHERMRGQVYETTRESRKGIRGFSRCIDCCFDCSVLWDTLSSYAAQNELDPYGVLDKVLRFHVFSDTLAEVDRWQYTGWYLRRGDLTQAIAVLESDGDDPEGTDWVGIAGDIAEVQPRLAERVMSSLQSPASRFDFIQFLGSLSEPLTLISTNHNSLCYADSDFAASAIDYYPPKRRRRDPI